MPQSSAVGDNQGGVSVAASADLSNKVANTTNFGAIGGPQINASGFAPGFFNEPLGAANGVDTSLNSRFGMPTWIIAAGAILVVTGAIIFARR